MSSWREASAIFVQPVIAAYEALKRRWYVWVLVLLVASVYSSLSILRHLHFASTAFDLGIFDQAIWQYSHFSAPYNSVRSNRLTENLLGDHFHPILVVLAPIYWFTDRVEALLVAQALLFAVAIVPIFLFTEKRLGKIAAYLFAISYSIFWGVQKAVEFDFHEIAFAAPLVALAIYCIDEKRWRIYFVCLFLLVITKENLSILVFFFGVYLLFIREFKRGLISMGVGVVGFLAATKLFIPYFIDEETRRADGPGKYYRYWSYNHLGSGPIQVLTRVFKNPLLITRTFVSPSAKLQTYWYLFHPFLFLPLLTPLFILAIPLLAERFLSENPNLWAADFHYNAVIAPILVMASVDSLHRITGKISKFRKAYLIIPIGCLVLSLNLRLVPEFPLWRLATADYWKLTESDRIGRRALRLIPPTASVAAQGPITPHLSHRTHIYVLHPGGRVPDSDFIVASDKISPFPFPNHDGVTVYLNAQQARGYRKIFEENGWVVLAGGPLPDSPNRQFVDAAFIEQSVPDTMIAGHRYDVFVTMRNTGLTRWTSSELFRLAYLSGTRDWVLERVELPSTIEPGHSVTFSFQVVAPAKPGKYSFHWGMVQDGVAAFGETAPQVLVNVVKPDAK